MEKQENKENKKTVVEVAKQYQEVTNEAAKKKIVESCGIKTYLPIRDKIQLIVNAVYDRLGQVDEDGLASYDGIDGMVYLILCLVRGYTELELGEELEDFDALMSSGLMDAIFDYIGDDAEVFENMFEMELDHFVQEHNTLSTYIEIVMRAILEPLNTWSNTVMDFVDENGGIENFTATIQTVLDRNEQIETGK